MKNTFVRYIFILISIILVKFSIFTNLTYIFIFKIIIILIMTLSQFSFDPTLKILNISFLRFFEWSESENQDRLFSKGLLISHVIK